MRKLPIVLCLVASAWFPALAQTNIDAMEYYIDTDPGVGSGIPIPVSAATTQDVNFNINTSSLSVGFHTIVVRVKDQSGTWGIQESKVFYIAAEAIGFNAIIGDLEYHIDSDPAVGNGISIPVSAATTQDVDFNINTSSLSVGFHTIVVRAKDQSGNWGVQGSKTLYVTGEAIGFNATIGDLEYYFDADPGPGNGTSFTFTTGHDVDILRDVVTSSLPVGFHVLHIRSIDSNGNWGIPDSRPFYVVEGNVGSDDDIVELEYFFDTEPGYGAGTPLSVTAGTQIDLQTLVSSASLTNGFHTINIRSKYNGDVWGFAETKGFYVDGYSQVTGIEYYIDTDPGNGAATTVPVASGSLVDVDFEIATTSISPGSHTIGIRGAGTDGTWGGTRTFSFSVQDTQTISFDALTAATYGDAPFDLAATSSSGLPITYVSSDPLVATISGATVTVVGAGTTIITASQAGDGTYTAAADIQQTLVVNKANQVITFDPLPEKTVGDPPFTLNATSNSALSVVYSSSNTSVATISGNTVTIVGAGTTDITASQAGNGNYNPATDVVQSLVVLPAPSVNNPPAISGQPTNAFFVNDPVVVHGSIIVTDTDGTISSATVSITTGFQSGEDELTFIAQGSIAGSYDSNSGVLTLSNVGDISDYQAVLRSVRYNNASTDPKTNDRTISFQVSDGITTSNVIIATITINKPPLIEAPPKETQAGGNIVFTINDIFSDPDNNLDFSTLTVVSSHGALITISNGSIIVNYNAIPDYEGTDHLTMTICDQGGRCQSQIVAVEIGADIDVYNGISANGDDMNAYFRIRFLPEKSHVSIFNRWGDRVYENNDYDSNDPAKRFEGNTNDGTPLTEGTYYYKIVAPGRREIVGYLQIKR